MQTQEEIKKKLLDMGAAEADIEGIMQDVNEIIFQKAMDLYFARLRPA